MKNRTQISLAGLLLLAAGCGNDAELARMAQETVASQREQTRAMHQQQQGIVDSTHELAKAADQLVEKDADARREMIVAHRDMRSELHAERISIDRQRESLEQDRRDLAHQRRTDPVIAEAIQATALWLACLSPLILASFVLVAAHRGNEDQAVAEMLVLDLTADRPQFIPTRQELQRLEGHSASTALPGPGNQNGLPESSTE